MTTEPTAKQKEEASGIASLWWHEDIEGEAEIPHGSLAKLTNRIATVLSSRNREIRKVLEGLRNDGGCWCPYVDDTRVCGPACLAARALWERVNLTESADWC